MKKIICSLIIAVLCLTLMPVGVVFAQGTTFNVPGDYPTIQAAINAAYNAGGGTVLVAPSSYHERITMKSGVDIQGSGAGVTTIWWGSEAEWVVKGANNSTISGFTISGEEETSGIFCSGSSPTITNNIITNCLLGKSWAAGIYLYNSSATITNNIIVYNDPGIFCSNSSPTIANNTIVYNGFAGFTDTDHQHSYPTITNNIITGNHYGIRVEDSTPTIDYNDVWGNSYNYSGCSAGANDISADPLFVGVGDYHLQEGSPCIDTGNDAAVPAWLTTDFDDDPRIMGAAVDMGADEYGVPSVSASIDIDPNTLNLKSKGVFTVYIILPEGYDVANIAISTVTCEGASAIRGVVDGDVLIVKFNRQDLTGVQTGEAVTLTVSGNTLDGTPFEGSDTIRVIDKGK